MIEINKIKIIEKQILSGRKTIAEFKDSVFVENSLTNVEKYPIYKIKNRGMGKCIYRKAIGGNARGVDRHTIGISHIVGSNVETDLRVCPKQQDEHTGSPQQITIDISHLANGMYFLKIDGKVFKIVKN
jgi:hypothetical protein